MSTKQLLTFDLLVNDTNQSCFEEARYQLAPHPDEAPEFTAARILTLCHNLKYHPTVGADSSEQGEASAVSYDEYGKLILWCQVGDVSRKSYKAIERLKRDVLTRVYFYERSHIDRFCALMRGTKENWLSDLEFYLFGDNIIHRLTAQGLERRNRWEVSFIEQALYISRGEELLEGTLQPLDIWQLYQESLDRAAELSNTYPRPFS